MNQWGPEEGNQNDQGNNEFDQMNPRVAAMSVFAQGKCGATR
jgi:hypothetical protein